MANTVFLKIPGIEGEAEDAGFEAQIAVMSYSFGMSNPVDRHKSVGEVQFQDVSIVKAIDKGSPALYKACCLGNEFSEPVILSCARSAGDYITPFLEVTLHECVVSSISLSGSDGGGLPTENVTFAFGKIEFKYKTEDDKQTESTWNLDKNTPDI